MKLYKILYQMNINRYYLYNTNVVIKLKINNDNEI